MRIERIAAVGAVGVALAVLVVYLAFVYLTRPAPDTAGMDWGHSRTTWISIGVLVSAIAAVHLALARQLWRGAQLRP